MSDEKTEMSARYRRDSGYWRISDVARPKLSVEPRTVINWIKKHYLDAHQWGGRGPWYISKEHFALFLEMYKARNSQPPDPYWWLGDATGRATEERTKHTLRVRTSAQDQAPEKLAPTETSLRLQRDRVTFDASNAILSQVRLEPLLDRLEHGMSFWDSEIGRLHAFLLFFEQEGNKYADPNLRYVCHIFCERLQSLFSQLEIDSCERMWLHNGPSDTVDSFRDDGDEDDLYYTQNGRHNWEYVLLPGIASPVYQVLQKEDPTDLDRRRSNYQRELQRLTASCREASKTYRAAIRDTLLV